MFMSLDEADLKVVIDAVDMRKTNAGEFVIEEGEPGEVLYIVESGDMSCTKIIDGKETEKGDRLTEDEQREVYKTIFEIAIINASLSKDEFRVMAHLRDIFSIDDEEHQIVEDELRDMVKERFEDPNVVEKTLSTLRDSVRLVTTLFDNVRKKNHGES